MSKTNISISWVGEYHLKYSSFIYFTFNNNSKIYKKYKICVLFLLYIKIVVILKLFAITINLPLKLDFIEDIKNKVVASCDFI
jgi:hypothetical protein